MSCLSVGLKYWPGRARGKWCWQQQKPCAVFFLNILSSSLTSLSPSQGLQKQQQAYWAWSDRSQHIADWLPAPDSMGEGWLAVSSERATFCSHEESERGHVHSCPWRWLSQGGWPAVAVYPGLYRFCHWKCHVPGNLSVLDRLELVGQVTLFPSLSFIKRLNQTWLLHSKDEQSQLFRLFDKKQKSRA